MPGVENPNWLASFRAPNFENRQEITAISIGKTTEVILFLLPILEGIKPAKCMVNFEPFPL